MKGKFDATDVASLSTSPENFQAERKKKAMIQVEISIKKEKYMSMLMKRTDTTA